MDCFVLSSFPPLVFSSLLRLSLSLPFPFSALPKNYCNFNIDFVKILKWCFFRNRTEQLSVCGLISKNAFVKNSLCSLGSQLLATEVCLSPVEWLLCGEKGASRFPLWKERLLKQSSKHYLKQEAVKLELCGSLLKFLLLPHLETPGLNSLLCVP